MDMISMCPLLKRFHCSYSETSDKGHSKKRTTSLQRTKCWVPSVSIIQKFHWEASSSFPSSSPYLEEDQPPTQEISSQLRVDCSRMQGAHRHSTPRNPFSEFSSEHDVGDFASAVGQLGVVPAKNAEHDTVKTLNKGHSERGQTSQQRTI